MKILFLIRALEVGGSQRQLSILAAGLARKNHDVAVAVFYRGGRYEKELLESGVRIVSLEKIGRWDVLGVLFRLYRAFRSERPDIIYSFLPTQNVVAALTPRPRSSRLVFGIRSAGMDPDRYDFLSGQMYRAEVLLSSRATLIIANAFSGKDDAVVRGLPVDRIVVVPNGIDADAMRPDAAAGRRAREEWGISPAAFVVGMVARFDPMKDHQTFLAAAAVFATQNPDARFVCVGEGPETYQKQLQKRTDELGIADRILWATGYKDLRAAYNAFDVATLTSAFGEAFPNVVAEAMACGKVVVGTDVGDTSKIVGAHGEVVAPAQPELLSSAWARARSRLASDEALGARARQRIVENYGLSATVDQTERIFQDLCSGRSV
jgi:glycosyltransferase involved in cell wall biosynthesis